MVRRYESLNRTGAAVAREQRKYGRSQFKTFSTALVLSKSPPPVQRHHQNHRVLPHPAHPKLIQVLPSILLSSRAKPATRGRQSQSILAVTVHQELSAEVRPPGRGHGTIAAAAPPPSLTFSKEHRALNQQQPGSRWRLNHLQRSRELLLEWVLLAPAPAPPHHQLPPLPRLPQHWWSAVLCARPRCRSPRLISILIPVSPETCGADVQEGRWDVAVETAYKERRDTYLREVVFTVAILMSGEILFFEEKSNRF